MIGNLGMGGHAKPSRDGLIQEKKRSSEFWQLVQSAGLLPKGYDEIKLDSVIRRFTQYGLARI